MAIEKVSNGSGSKLRLMRKLSGQRKAHLLSTEPEHCTPQARAFTLWEEQHGQALHRASGALGRNRANGGKAPRNLGPEHEAKHAALAALLDSYPSRSNAWVSAKLKRDGHTMSAQAVGQHKKAKANKPR